MKWLRDPRVRAALIYTFSFTNVGFDVWWMSLCGAVFTLVVKPHTMGGWAVFVAQMTVWMLIADFLRGYRKALQNEGVTVE